MFGVLLMLGTALVVYGIAWGVTWLLGRLVPLPARLGRVLPWLLFQLYLVVGLFVTGDLPGAPRAVLRFLLIAAGLSLLFGALAWWRNRGRAAPAGVGRAGAAAGATLPQLLIAWLLAGTLPWALALLAEVG